MNISQMNDRDVREIFSDTKELANALLCIAEDSDPSTAYYLMEAAYSMTYLYRDACAMQKHIKRNAMKGKGGCTVCEQRQKEAHKARGES